MRTALAFGTSLVVLALSACAGTTPPATNAPATSSAPVQSAKVEPTKGALARKTVNDTVQQGLGAFLQKITVDDRPVFAEGKFHGFRIASISDELAGSELKPGDVVTRVNGMAIERPEQALEAFKSLEVASELRIDYERNGEPHALRIPIVDDAAAPKK